MYERAKLYFTVNNQEVKPSGFIVINFESACKKNCRLTCHILTYKDVKILT